jgi:hypothetical protein
MSTLTAEITETLKSLDPVRARALERALHEMLVAVRPPSSPPAPLPAVDANGWPIGYWEKFAGCLEGDDWEPQPDPPPEPHPS